VPLYAAIIALRGSGDSKQERQPQGAQFTVAPLVLLPGAARARIVPPDLGSAALIARDLHDRGDAKACASFARHYLPQQWPFSPSWALNIDPRAPWQGFSLPRRLPPHRLRSLEFSNQ